jgi:hypothetical protein
VMAENIFDALSVCSKVGKVLNLNFVTFEKSKKNEIQARTAFCDVLRLIIGVALVIKLFVDLSDRAFELTSRSVIFEIGLLINSQIEFIHLVIVMLQMFVWRHEYFRILRNLQWIDEKVSAISSLETFYINACRFS